MSKSEPSSRDRALRSTTPARSDGCTRATNSSIDRGLLPGAIPNSRSRFASHVSAPVRMSHRNVPVPDASSAACNRSDCSRSASAATCCACTSAVTPTHFRIPPVAPSRIGVARPRCQRYSPARAS
ncbi:MAG TPA: hypothetical protein VEA69_13900 [Tepidisphaeraceae bacterium]|nr:hypothetical protein [Tepidisphaeraceae bacterium]